MNDTYGKKLTFLNQDIKKYLKYPIERFKLVIVTKSQEKQKISKILNYGCKTFGENYVDEAIKKIEFFKENDIEWHFIGKIQSNKIKKLCKYFDWVQTVCSEEHAIKLNNECQKSNKCMNICIQINIDDEPTKSGINILDLDDFIMKIDKLKNISIRGLMAIPSKSNTLKECSDSYNILRLAFEKYKNENKVFDTLSLGMSNDYLIALKSGSTMLRIGQYIFGERIEK
jgi:pyridoxal phosphate enzyme (YggS family)